MNVYTSNKLTLYYGRHCLSFCTAIWRVMFPDRIILETDMPAGKANLHLLEETSDNLILKHIEHGRRDDSSNGTEVLVCKNLKLHRKWIPGPMSLSATRCTIFTEYTCEIEEKWMQ